MSVASKPPLARAVVSRARSGVAGGLPALGGIALIAVLVPARGNWAAGIVSLALSLTVPGVVLLRALRIETRVTRAYPPIVVAAALTVLLLAGLAVDLLSPLLGQVRPLHGSATALGVIGLSLWLWILGLPAARRCTAWRMPDVDPTLLIPLVLPLIAAVGALLLSHGHAPTLARVGQGLVGIVLFGSLMFAPRLTRAQLAVLLFGCALAAEWAFSLRSQEVVGFDINTEIHIAQRIQRVGVWHSLNQGNAYSAMLSVTVLPSVLRSLSGCSPLIAFKIVYPMLTALLPVWVFLIAGRHMRRGFAASAAALLIVQTYFFQLVPQLARQEIAFFFFSALVAILVDDRVRLRSRVILVALLSADTVVSHYSTTYLVIPIVIVSLGLAWLLARLRVTAYVAALACAAAVLVGGAAMWYGPITHSSQNLAQFNSKIEHSGLDLLPNSGGGIINSYLNGANVSSLTPAQFQRLAVRTFAKRSAYIHPLPAARQAQYDLRAAHVNVTAPRLARLSSALQVLSIAFAEVLLLFAGVGALVLAWRGRGRTSGRIRGHPPRNAHIGVIALATAGTLLLIRFSGTIAVSYNQTRALAQALIVLAIPGRLVRPARPGPDPPPAPARPPGPDARHRARPYLPGDVRLRRFACRSAHRWRHAAEPLQPR
jgi:hypothetical protein